MTVRFGFISTYPPTQCGLATFTSALLGALTVESAPGLGSVFVVGLPAPLPKPRTEAETAPATAAAAPV